MKLNKRERIDVRCSPEEKEHIKEQARIRGMTTSEYCRTILIGRLVRVRVKDSAYKPV
jgi:predicted DNA binding CopG/RHH family protein